MHAVEQRLQTSLLGTVEEISRLVVSHRGNPQETLTNIARLLQRTFKSDVCSVYLMQPDRLHLVLSATVGLRDESVGRVRMPLTDGLVGLVAETLEPQMVADASVHPRFRYFPEAGEDQYHSFLGVPIVDRGLLVGVLVVQTRERRLFDRDEVTVVAAAAAQLAAIVGDARLEREAQLQAERLRVVQITMRAVHDVVNNCLNQLQWLRLEAEGKVPDESLTIFDDAIAAAAERLSALEHLDEFTEHRMAAGPGLGPDRTQISAPR